MNECAVRGVPRFCSDQRVIQPLVIALLMVVSHVPQRPPALCVFIAQRLVDCRNGRQPGSNPDISYAILDARRRQGYPVTCEIDGKAHRGTYWIAGKILTVATGMGGKSTQVGSTPAEALAKRLLQDLAKEGKA